MIFFFDLNHLIFLKQDCIIDDVSSTAHAVASGTGSLNNNKVKRQSILNNNLTSPATSPIRTISPKMTIQTSNSPSLNNGTVNQINIILNDNSSRNTNSRSTYFIGNKKARCDEKKDINNNEDHRKHNEINVVVSESNKRSEQHRSRRDTQQSQQPSCHSIRLINRKKRCLSESSTYALSKYADRKLINSSPALKFFLNISLRGGGRRRRRTDGNQSQTCSEVSELVDENNNNHKSDNNISVSCSSDENEAVNETTSKVRSVVFSSVLSARKRELLLVRFDCNFLVFKRSFSQTNTSLVEKKCLIKKYSSFDNFFKNIAKGKRKSNSFCNFNNNTNRTSYLNGRPYLFVNVYFIF